MVAETSIIETGVDRLVNLVKFKGRISSYDAVKELGLSATVIMEWADFLEEEGIIKVEYKFTKAFLVARKLEKKEVQEKAKEFSGKKDVFIRKAEGSLSFLKREAAELNTIKEEFDKIKKELGVDISSFKNELQDLEKYERLKIGMDKQIEEQKRASMDKIEVMTRQILKDKKEYEGILSEINKEEIELEKYEGILSEINKEEIELEKDEGQVRSLEESEKLIRDKIEGLKEMIKNVENKAVEGEEEIKLSEKDIQKLALVVQNIRNRIEKEKELIAPLVKRSEEQTKKIKELQDIVINKIEEKEKKLKGTKKVSKKVRELFNKKMGIFGLIEKINKDRNDLQKELIDLIRKAKSFQLSSKNSDIGGQITDIEKKFKEVDAKKEVFEKELEKLGLFLK